MEPVFIAILTTLCVCLAAAYWMLSGLVDKLDDHIAELKEQVATLKMNANHPVDVVRRTKPSRP